MLVNTVKIKDAFLTVVGGDCWGMGEYPDGALVFGIGDTYIMMTYILNTLDRFIQQDWAKIWNCHFLIHSKIFANSTPSFGFLLSWFILKDYYSHRWFCVKIAIKTNQQFQDAKKDETLRFVAVKAEKLKIPPHRPSLVGRMYFFGCTFRPYLPSLCTDVHATETVTDITGICVTCHYCHYWQQPI